ncbi:MAG: hypothetical protein K6F17_08080 [Lachnospiraceae bacterium]|nr:hypothetical protein [Lachnospiraceae bacterium]
MELKSLELIALGLPFGLIGVGLCFIAAETALFAWVADGRDVYQHVAWNGTIWYTFSGVESASSGVSYSRYSSGGGYHSGAYGKF